MNKVGWISPAACLEHQTGPGHPERPARLDKLNRHLQETGLLADLNQIQARQATVEDLCRAHGKKHVNYVLSRISEGYSSLDPDTTISSRSGEAALLAAGAAITGVETLFQGNLEKIFCGVRPPGHHAESDRAMGFCLFNNAAVAATYALAKGWAERILILDWDVHHGNGTQEVFAQSPHVFYYSLHQYPFYPGTGAATEIGVGEGRGFTLNRPLPAGTGDGEYLKHMEKDLRHIADSFKPQLIIVSAGFDAHRDDPLASMKVTESGFATMTEMVASLAQECCEGRMLSVLEGGYDLDALSHSVFAHLKVLTGN